MKRAVKRISEKLNVEKRLLLKESCLAYAKEKRYLLDELRSEKFQSKLGSHRQIRDEKVQDKYKSRVGLQARQWKLALQDAVETWDKYWQSLFVLIRPKIAKKFAEEERHYAFWLLAGYPQFTACRKGEASTPPFPFPAKKCDQVAAWLQNIIRKQIKNFPIVRQTNSMKLDADCYQVFEEKGRQYIKVMSLQKKKRIAIPLLGKSAIRGNIVLVLKEDRVEIHVTHELDPVICKESGPIEAVDFGFTEVMTDTENLRYGTKLGSILTSASDHICEKVKNRNKLRDLSKKTSSKIKSRRIRKYNLGTRKFRSREERTKGSIKTEINTAIHQLIKTKKPSTLITEDLKHPFIYNKSKRVNRRLSAWVRGEIQERISFKALVEGFHHKQVNPAYGSQTCILCGFVDSRNRKGDKFRCLHCKHEDAADRVAAQNLFKRLGDPEIQLGTPPASVKTILLNRFHRRLETEQSVTVQGRSLEAVLEECLPPLSKQCYSREKKYFENRTVEQRAKRKTRIF